MQKKYILSCTLIFLLVLKGLAQNDDTISIRHLGKNFTISGYVDAYYAYYTDSVGAGNFQKFPSISPRTNKVGLNTAQVSFEYNAEKVRGIMTLHFGDIAKSAWSPTFNNVMEARVGVRLHKKLWIDAGFFRTHVGVEGLLPKENLVSSISINTFYEPYYEVGARLNYLPNDKWSVSLYALNGYNIYEDRNDKKSLGLLVTYALSDKGNIGYSNYTGDDAEREDTLSRLRIHQSLFMNYRYKKLKIQVGGDYCMQQHANIADPKKWASMYSGVAGLKYQFLKRFAIAVRGELFSDAQGFMSGVFLDIQNKYTGFKLWGVTLSAEYNPTRNSYIRIEGRQLQMNKNQEIFYWEGKNTSRRWELLCNVGISF